jgi:Transposase
VTRLPMAACAAGSGIDGAAATHALCVHVTDAATRAFSVLEPRSETLEAWVSTWRTRFPEQPMAIGLALTQGPLVAALRQDDCRGLLPLNPRMLARSRAACTPSRAKDDPTDAELRLALLRKPGDPLTPLPPQRPPRRARAPLVAHRRRVGGDHGRLPNRLTRTLQPDLPPVRHGCHDHATAIVCDCRTPWPTLQAGPLARRSPLARFCRDHHVRDAAGITPRLDAIQRAPPLTTAAGLRTPQARGVQARVAPRRVTVHALAVFDKARAHRAQRPPDGPVFDALPGAGAVCAPRRLGAVGEPRDRDASAEERQR